MIVTSFDPATRKRPMTRYLLIVLQQRGVSHMADGTLNRKSTDNRRFIYDAGVCFFI